MRTLAGAALALAALGAAATAQAAEPGYATANVNIRTGPDIDFPSIGVIPEGDPIRVQGCLRDESWCDVKWGPDRGWVYSEYLAFEYRGEMVPLLDVGLSVYDIPFVRFSARDYWGRYYVGRPWYKNRDRWYGFKVRPRRGWNAPPPGKRNPGWWRKGYNAPKGMRAPDRNWKGKRRDDRGDRRDGRRDDRGDDRRGDRRDDRRGDRGGDHRGGDHRGGDNRGGDHRGGGRGDRH
jgi:uncharacterized protein YraI